MDVKNKTKKAITLFVMIALIFSIISIAITAEDTTNSGSDNTTNTNSETESDSNTATDAPVPTLYNEGAKDQQNPKQERDAIREKIKENRGARNQDWQKLREARDQTKEGIQELNGPKGNRTREEFQKIREQRQGLIGQFRNLRNETLHKIQGLREDQLQNFQDLNEARLKRIAGLNPDETSKLAGLSKDEINKLANLRKDEIAQILGSDENTIKNRLANLTIKRATKQELLRERIVKKEEVDKAKQHFQEAKKELDTAKNNYQQLKADFESKRESARQCQSGTSNKTSECKNLFMNMTSNVKQRILNSIDIVIAHLNKIKDNANANDALTDLELSNMSLDTDNGINQLNTLKTKVDAMTSKEDIKSAAKEFADLWGELKTTANIDSGKLIMAHTVQITKRAEMIQTKMEENIAELEGNSTDTTQLNIKVDSFNQMINSAKASIESAKQLHQQAIDIRQKGNLTADDKDTIKSTMDNAQKDMADARSQLNNAQQILKAVEQMLRQYNKSVDISDNEIIQVSEKAQGESQ